MDVREIAEVSAGIRAGLYADEANVSAGIVSRLLASLGWPVFNPNFVKREFKLDNGRVDYALFRNPHEPYLFIEVKRVGNIDKADKQIFEYMFHRGVPLAIITDGAIWQFFLPTEPGDYSEREFLTFNVTQSAPSECVDAFHNFLSFERVCNGAALAAAKDVLLGRRREKRTKLLLPDVWEKMLLEPNEMLVNLGSGLIN